jgi:RIO kinase 1
MWAEKEARNLSRMHDAGIRCPKPLQLRNHVLAMTFIGRDSKVCDASQQQSPRAPQCRTRSHACRLRRGCAMQTSVKTNGLNYTRRCVFPVTRTPQREFSQVIVAMHIMWNKCKLVHGDLSEYNILYCPAHPHPRSTFSTPPPPPSS